MPKYRIKFNSIKASKIINGDYSQVAAIHIELTHVHSNTYWAPDSQKHVKQLVHDSVIAQDKFRRVSDILSRYNIKVAKVDFFTSEVLTFQTIRNAAISEKWTFTAIERQQGQQVGKCTLIILKIIGGNSHILINFCQNFEVFQKLVS